MNKTSKSSSYLEAFHGLKDFVISSCNRSCNLQNLAGAKSQLRAACQPAWACCSLLFRRIVFGIPAISFLPSDIIHNQTKILFNMEKIYRADLARITIWIFALQRKIGRKSQPYSLVSRKNPSCNLAKSYYNFAKFLWLQNRLQDKITRFLRPWNASYYEGSMKEAWQ